MVNHVAVTGSMVVVMVMVNNVQGLEQERVYYNQQQEKGRMSDVLLHNSGNRMQK